MNGTAGRVEGSALIFFFLVYLLSFFSEGRRGQSAPPSSATPEVSEVRGGTAVLALALLLLGLGVVLFSAELVVKHAIRIAEAWGVQHSFVGAVIVALGTSLPELAISVNAALRQKPGLALGNIAGANVFDSLVPIGVAATISPVHFDAGVLRFDLPYLLVVTGVFVWFLMAKPGLQRREGLWLIGMYSLYLLIRIAANRNFALP